MKKILLICGLVFATMNINAQTWNIGSPVLSNVTATLNNDTLTISGIGNMRDWQYPHTPWGNETYTIRVVIINYGVTSIGTEAFRFFSSLMSVTIPSSVTSIGMGAFNNTGITSIVIPEGVTTIGSIAFFQSTNLASIVLPESLTSIGSGAFADATSLTSITLPSNIQFLAEGVFSRSGLTYIRIPNSLSQIHMNAFQGSTALTSVTLGNRVSWISLGAFAETGLTSITSLSPIPPTIAQGIMPGTGQVFEGLDISTIRLYVLREALVDYQTADIWRYFDIREAGNTDLRSLSVSEGTMSPEFDAEITTYTVYVHSSISSFVITAEADDEVATIDGTGTKTFSEDGYVFNIIVTARDEVTTKTYTLSVVPYWIVVFNSQGGSTVSSQKVKRNESVERPINPIREYFLFGGWYRDVEGVNVWDFNVDIVTSDITLYARWSVDPSTIDELVAFLFDSINVLHQELTTCNSLLTSIGILNDSIKGLHQQLTTCNNQRNDLNDTITSRNNRITTLLGNISDLQGLNTTLRDSINLLFQLLADCEGTGTSNAPFIPTNQIQIYPNPVSYELRIINHEWEQDNVVELFDINGRRVFTGRGYGDVFTIDMSSFHPGNYILRIGHRVARVVRQ